MDNPIVIAQFQNRMQAETALNLLESFGIETMIWADDLGGIGPGQSFVRGVKLLVDAGDEHSAKQVLEKQSERDNG